MRGGWVTTPEGKRRQKRDFGQGIGICRLSGCGKAYTTDGYCPKHYYHHSVGRKERVRVYSKKEDVREKCKIRSRQLVRRMQLAIRRKARYAYDERYRERIKERVKKWYETSRGRAYQAGMRQTRRALGKIDSKLLERMWAETTHCVLCGDELDDSRHLDHIIPICLGGTNASGNLRYICADCNLARPRRKFRQENQIVSIHSR